MRGTCEVLGIDPFDVANEGKFVAFVAAERALAALRATEEGADAAIVGEVISGSPGRVLGRTSFGGHRIIDLLVVIRCPESADRRSRLSIAPSHGPSATAPRSRRGVGGPVVA